MLESQRQKIKKGLDEMFSILQEKYDMTAMVLWDHAAAPFYIGGDRGALESFQVDSGSPIMDMISALGDLYNGNGTPAIYVKASYGVGETLIYTVIAKRAVLGMLCPYGLEASDSVLRELRTLIFERRDNLGLENIEGDELPGKGPGEDTFTYFNGFQDLSFGLLSKEGS